MGLSPLSPNRVVNRSTARAASAPTNPLNAQQVLQQLQRDSFDSGSPSGGINLGGGLDALNATKVLQQLQLDPVKPPTFEIEQGVQPNLQLDAPQEEQKPQGLAPDQKNAAPEAAPEPSGLAKVLTDIGAALTALADAITAFAAAVKALFGKKDEPAPPPEEEPKEEPKDPPADVKDGVDGALVGPLQAIARDEEGQKLIQAAMKNGLKGIHVGELAEGVMGETTNGQITISPEALKNPADVVRTMAHELGHAVTPNNGTSVAEEKGVDAIAKRIQERVQPGETFELNDDAYGDLEKDNGYDEAMKAAGFEV